MQIPLSLQIVGFLVLFFSVFALSRDDFTLLRKSVSLDTMYDAFFISSAVGLLTARFGFVLFHFKPLYLHILAFLAFPYFPGLDPLLAIIGGYVALKIFCYIRKLPLARIADIFSLSYLYAIVFSHGVWVFILLVTKKLQFQESMSFLILLISCVILKFVSKKIEDGNISILVTLFLSLAIFFNSLALSKSFISQTNDLHESLVFIILSALLFFFRQSAIFNKPGKQIV